MPESMSVEQLKMVQYLGARIELTPAAERMSNAIRRASELRAEIPELAEVLQQFENPANPAIHRATTAEEIWRDSGGQVVDIFVAGVQNRRHHHRRGLGAQPT